jgi:anti-anti-sigma factor
MTTAANGWVEASEPGENQVLRICGDLDMAGREVIETAVLAAIDSASSVTLDLAALEFCDSSGLSMFVTAQQKADARGTALHLTNVPRTVRRLFEITSLDALIGLIS